MRYLRPIALAAVLGLNGLALPAIAKEPPKDDPRLVEILSDPQAILSVIPALPDAITKIDPTLVKVFIYNERKRPETEALATVTESRLGEELLRLRRFKVIDARDVKTVHIQSDTNTFSVSNTIESTARLRQIGERMGADGVLMFSPQLQDRMVLIQCKMVRVTDGEILWTERFAYNFDLSRAEAEEARRAEEQARADAERKKQDRLRRTLANGWYFFGGMSLQEMTRAKAPGSSVPADLHSPSMGAFDIQYLGTTPYSEFAAFALGGTFGYSADGELSALSVSPELLFLFHLDPLFNKGVNEGNVTYYIGPNYTFMITPTIDRSPGVGGRTGLRLRMTEQFYLDLGAYYIPAWNYRFPTSAKYADTTNYGGLSFMGTVGFLIPN